MTSHSDAARPPRPPRPCPHPAQERTLLRWPGEPELEYCGRCGVELGRAARPAPTDAATKGEGD